MVATSAPLAVSEDGTKVFTAFALSGNHTTVIPPASAPLPLDGAFDSPTPMAFVAS